MSNLYNILYFDSDDIDNDDSDDDAAKLIEEVNDFDLTMTTFVLLELFAYINRINCVHKTPCRTSTPTSQ